MRASGCSFDSPVLADHLHIMIMENFNVYSLGKISSDTIGSHDSWLEDTLEHGFKTLWLAKNEKFGWGRK